MIRVASLFLCNVWSEFVAVGLAVLMVLPSSVVAQGQQPFFEKDFARGPFEKGEGGVDSGEQKDRPAARPTEAVESRSEIPSGEEKVAQETPSQTSPDLTALTKTHKVISIGGVINALDKEHFNEKLNELLEVVERYDLDVGGIWAIGSIQNLMSSPSVMYLVARQGLLEAAEEPPARFKVKMSPTWVLRTPDGDILLEATGPLAANFNAKGEFVERPSEMRVERREVSGSSESAPDKSSPTPPQPPPTPTPDPLFGGVKPRL